MATFSSGPACIACGCTNDNACAGGCSWVTVTPPKCSACFDVDGEAFAVGSADGDLFGMERCPASETPAPHAPLFTSATEWHCARCREQFFCEAA